MRFTYRIMALPLLTAVTFVVVFAVTFANVTEGSRLVRSLQAEFFTAVNLSYGLDNEALRIRHGLDTAVSLNDADMVDETESMATRFRELLEAGRQVRTIEPQQIADLTTAFERYDTLARRVTRSLIAYEDITSADARLLDDAAAMNAAYEDLRQRLDRLASAQVMNMRTALTDTQDRLKRRIRQATILAAGSVVLLLLLAAGAIVSIVNPLRKLRQAAATIAAGDLDPEIDYRSDDDLGMLADSFREMQRALETDIARREEIEHALRESEERLALALEAANDGIWDVRVPEDVFYCSDRFASILGYPRAEKPTSVREVDAMMSDVDSRDIERLLVGGQEAIFEVRTRRKNGRGIWVEIKGRTVDRLPDGRPKRVVGTISDITDRKRAEEELRSAQDRAVQSEKLASLGQLVAGLAHELNSPLGTLISGTDLIARTAAILRENVSCGDGIDRRTRRALDALERSSKSTTTAVARLEELLGGLKRFTALDRSNLQEADVHELLDTTITVMCDGQWDQVELERRYGDLPRIMCYPGQLNQVFLALVRNAMQAMEDGGTLTLSTDAPVEGRVRIVVADTGRGIPREDLDGIFEPGFRSGGGRVRLGWGLVTAARMVQEHGGRISAESEVGRGSQFTVLLPTRPDDPIED